MSGLLLCGAAETLGASHPQTHTGTRPDGVPQRGGCGWISDDKLAHVYGKPCGEIWGHCSEMFEWVFLTKLAMKQRAVLCSSCVVFRNYAQLSLTQYVALFTVQKLCLLSVYCICFDKMKELLHKIL